ncbi:DUF3108 domain-containing protein [Crenobacter luteus]|uniref:DUF3108 domain-containing protein n=1 Tax=Crenobacter luteus TaxID=1452487 RepID=A0A161S879_9NEIS|nr:DUF3108 domain-containing protein [Crenobacter luteus]KZE30032.1 hypothetical protein AVW16_12940 [Crenobacter luteus]
MRRLRLFVLAFAVSLAVHALLLAGGDWLPDIALPTPPERLAPITATLAAQRLDETPAAPSPPGALPAAGPAEPAPARPARAAAKRDASTAGDAAARHEASAPVAVRETPQHEAVGAAPADADPPRTVATGQNLVEPGRFPSQIAVRYRVYYGRLSTGGNVRWQAEAGRYRLDAYLSTFIGPDLHYRSEGRIGAQGLVPERYQAWRDSDERESATFDWDAGRLVYGDRDKEKQDAPLAGGAQDLLSMAWQLAVTGGADLGDTVQLTNGRKVYRYPLRLAGQTRYPDENGLTVLVVQSRHEDELTEFWLAPELNNLPVKIVRIDKNKRIEQHATRIDINGKSVWDLPAKND